MQPGVVGDGQKTQRAEREQCFRIDRTNQRDQEPACDVRATDLALRPHHKRFKELSAFNSRRDGCDARAPAHGGKQYSIKRWKKALRTEWN